MAELLADDPQGWARLSGLIAVLALPPVRDRFGNQVRRPVEVEIAPGVWQQVDRIAIEPHRLLFWFTNGVTNQFVVMRDSGIPRWRQAEQTSRALVQVF